MTDFLDRWANETPEQEARDMLERMGVENAQSFTTGEVVELANLIAENRQLLVELERWQVKESESLNKDNLKVQYELKFKENYPSKPYFTITDAFINGHWFSVPTIELDE